MSNLKGFYKDYADEIIAKRYESPYPLRRYAHEMQYASIVSQVKKGERVLDTGCGEGVLAVMLAKKGALVTACDISQPNVERAQEYAREAGVEVTFLVADSEHLPFANDSFDVVVSSHVLEHLPDFDKGLRELVRIGKDRVVFAVPTAFSLLSFVQLGGGWFYLTGVRSFLAFFRGMWRVFVALISGKDGVDETYAGSGMPHVFRFPFVVRRHVDAAGARVILQEASTLALPYFEALLPFSRFLDKFRRVPLLRSCGYGTTFVITRKA
ncbi:class I SAM-dependent methyltransferase [Patescibacteria group bacterium]|nr:class I SAM-dependent methyltransferase [Patescibacteria group bacterium]